MRRLILEEPYSEAALWSRRLAVFSAVLALIALLMARSQAVETVAALTVFGASILIACAAILLAGAGMVVIWRTGRKGAGQSVVAILLALALLAYPAWLSAVAVRLPLMNDISTDVNDPPAFSTAQVALAERNQRTPPAISERHRLEQQEAYPDIQPIVIDVDVKEGYKLVRDAVTSLGWKIVVEQEPATPADVAAPARPQVVVRAAPGIPVPPQRPAAPRPREAHDGQIDAVDRSLVMGFPDDIVIRIRSLPDQTRIDIRSASRYGRHDFGTNAKRIRAFAVELQAQLDAE